LLFSLIIQFVVLFLQEYEIDKSLGIKGPEDVARMGVAAYNEKCRAIVMRYSSEWEVINNLALRCNRHKFIAVWNTAGAKWLEIYIIKLHSKLH